MLGDFFAYFPACPEESTWGKYWGDEGSVI